MFYTNDFSVLCNGFINRYSKPIANWWRYWSNEHAYNHNRSDFRGNNSSDSRDHCMFSEEKEIIPTIFQQRRWVSKPHLHGPKKWGIFRSSCWGVWPDSGRQGNYFLLEYFEEAIWSFFNKLSCIHISNGKKDFFYNIVRLYNHTKVHVESVIICVVFFLNMNLKN